MASCVLGDLLLPNIYVLPPFIILLIFIDKIFINYLFFRLKYIYVLVSEFLNSIIEFGVDKDCSRELWIHLANLKLLLINCIACAKNGTNKITITINI